MILHEDERGCGYRHSGPKGYGIYLMGDGEFEPCERLPFPLNCCPSCGQRVKFSRSFTWIEDAASFLDRSPGCTGGNWNIHDHAKCYMCCPDSERALLIWVGARSYSPESFLDEARKMGISRRINNIPKDFVIGETPVYLAHIHAMPDDEPGIFSVFVPSFIDLVVDDENDVPDEALKLQEEYGDVRIVEVRKKQTEICFD